MKRHILFGLSLLLAAPMAVSAQDDLDEDLQAIAAPVRQAKKAAVKKYDTRQVTGRVLDGNTGKPVSGAIVKAEGVEGYSVLTAEDGTYKINVPVFTSALYISSPDHNAVSRGILKGEAQKDVKIYTKKFKGEYEEQTNVLANHSANNFDYSNAINIKEEVAKQLGAYAYTTERGGTPGIGAVTFIQGLNSLNVNAQPLVVVDGVVMDQQYDRTMIHQGLYNDLLSNIDPADIADVTVMRNGTALYGTRGANGVILITTKRSKSMATRITATAQAGVTFQPKFYSVMDGEQYRGYASELLKSTGTDVKSFKFLNNDPNYYYYNQYHNNTDWKKDLYRDAITMHYGVNVEGGDDVAMYNLSVGYESAQSSLVDNAMNRINIRFNTDIHMTKKLDVRFDASFSNLTRNLRDDAAPLTYEEGTPTSPSFLAYTKAPFLSPYSFGNRQLSTEFYDVTDESYLDEALEAYPKYNYRLANPYAINQYGEGENKNDFGNSVLNVALTPKWQFNKNLALSTHFSYTLVNTNNKYYIPLNGVPRYYVSSVNDYCENEISSLSSRQNSIQSDTRLTWNVRYDKHQLGLFGGVRLNFESYSTSLQKGYNTESDKIAIMSGALKNATSVGADEAWRNMDMYLQANYNYLGRYFAQLNLTASGSSRFGKEAAGGMKLFGVKWGVFPSLQTSWVMSNEPWYPKTGFINYMRFNAGFDVSGNDDINVFAARSYFASTMYQKTVAGLALGGVGNTNIKWETTRRVNFGFDARMLNDRLSFALNFFRGSTIDLLSLQQLSMLAGIKENWANSGRMSNVGCDLTIGAKPVVTKNVTWELGASLGTYKNRITSLGADGNGRIITPIAGGYVISQVGGGSANSFYGYKTAGVYATTAQAQAMGLGFISENGDRTAFEGGDVIFQDLNGDKLIDEKDMTIIGDPNPSIYGNIMTALTYKNLRLDVNFKYSVGNDVYNYMRSQLEGGNRFMNQTTAMTQRWMAEGQVTNMPKATFQDPHGNARFSDRWIEDGSYLKLKSVTLSYTLPMSSTFLQGLEFWVQGNNLFTLTKYLGSDPETAGTSAVIGQGIDFGSLAAGRSVVAGVKVRL